MFTITETQASKDRRFHIALGLLTLAIGLSTVLLAYVAYQTANRSLAFPVLVFGVVLQLGVALIGYHYTQHHHTDKSYRKKDAFIQHGFVMVAIVTFAYVAFSMISIVRSFDLCSLSLVAAIVFSSFSSFFAFDL